MIAPNGIFVITINIEKFSRNNFCLKNFFAEPIEGEIYVFQRQWMDPLRQREEVEKMPPEIIFL